MPQALQASLINSSSRSSLTHFWLKCPTSACIVIKSKRVHLRIFKKYWSLSMRLERESMEQLTPYSFHTKSPSTLSPTSSFLFSSLCQHHEGVNIKQQLRNLSKYCRMVATSCVILLGASTTQQKGFLCVCHEIAKTTQLQASLLLYAKNRPLNFSKQMIKEVHEIDQWGLNCSGELVSNTLQF